MDIQRKLVRYKTVKKRKVPVFTYFDKKTKKKIDNKKFIDRINKLRIPPAYRMVKISKSAQSKIQATGVDVKKRVQYIYNPKYTAKQSENKFRDLIIFGNKISKIRKDIRNILKETGDGKRELLSKESIIALALYLVDTCNFRIGSQKYKLLYKTFGVTTLNKKHFKKMGKNYEIEFIGKKMVLNKGIVNKMEICSLFDKLLSKNAGEYIFNSKEKGIKSRITEKHVNGFLKKYDKTITVKMFRTWKANTILLKELLDFPLPEDEKSSRENLNQVIKKVAFKLHHTRNVSKKSYMNNRIIEMYLNNPLEFKKLLVKFKGKNNKLPNIDSILNNFLKQFNK